MIKTVISYLKYSRKYLVLYLVITGIYQLVFYLHGFGFSAVSYAWLLTFVILLIISIIDFLLYYRRIAQIKGAYNQVMTECRDLPQAQDVIEQTYQDMVATLFQNKVETESRNAIFRQEMFDYYSMWVHQIKTPIAVMRMLLQSGEAETQRKEMELELFKTEQYVEMVLSYLRMEGMSGDLVFQTCSMDEIVKRAVRKYSKMFILNKVKLKMEELGEQVLTDEKWLGFVIEQLLSNAVKYTKSGGTIAIYMDREKEGTLVIADSGIGIYEEDLPRVFERGYTGYTGRQNQKSTGIGLYLCKKIMDKLRHRIYITSEVSKGTKVFIHLSRKELKTD